MAFTGEASFDSMTAKEETKGVSVGVATVNMNPLKEKRTILAPPSSLKKKGTGTAIC